MRRSTGDGGIRGGLAGVAGSRKLKWYVSCKSGDGTEIACMRRSAWRRSDKSSTSGSKMKVVGEFQVASWEEAMQAHNDLHGFGKYVPF